MITQAKPGAYPTMVTPYNSSGDVDYGAVKELVGWYSECGCDGIFASCQSSEISFLSLKDRVRLARVTKDTADELYRSHPERGRLMIVASGHISCDTGEQITELRSVVETGVDALILITNRMDIPNTSDANWISDTERLISALPGDIALGAYECPRPYKRLMTGEMLRFCAGSGRFFFMKDTCCDPDEIEKRCAILGGSNMSLFNANAQTLLASLKSGAAGYCGVMCNFHPKLYSWLCHNWKTEPKTAEKVQAFLCLCAFTESLAYPVTAKYHLKTYEGIHTEISSRSRDDRELTPYQKSCVAQMKLLADELEGILGL